MQMVGASSKHEGNELETGSWHTKRIVEGALGTWAESESV